MRVRSTGMGKTELKCVVGKMEARDKNVFLVHMQSTAPITNWHIRAIVEPEDLFQVMVQLLKPSSLLAIAKILLKREPRPEGEW